MEMTTLEVNELYAYNRWAAARILGAVAPLDAEQFTRDTGSSHPSVRDTLVHILGAEWVWLSRWRGVSPRAMSPGWSTLDYEGLVAQWRRHEAEQAEFLEGLTDGRLDEPVSYTNLRGDPFTMPLRHLLRHVVNHSSYHRGQVTTMLRQLGMPAVATDLVLFHTSRTATAARQA
jgi:uncharacterized damage-inducible protein DinB